jgi:hypothetical protein
MAKKKQDCYECIFREKLIGDAHSKCIAKIDKGDVKAEWNQWSIGFPNNFDPTWIKSCKKYITNNDNQ